MVTKYSRAIDPATGDRVFDDALRTWSSALTPELAIVQNVLRTPLGSAGRDRTYGVKGIENAGPNAGAVWRFNVLHALKRWIDRGVLRDVEVPSEVRKLPEGGAALFYTVIFKGRDGRARTTPERRALGV